MENAKICQLVKVGKTVDFLVKCVIMSQGKLLEVRLVVILGWMGMRMLLTGVKLHGSNIAITKDVEKLVENLARNAQVSARLKFVNNIIFCCCDLAINAYKSFVCLR